MRKDDHPTSNCRAGQIWRHDAFVSAQHLPRCKPLKFTTTVAGIDRLSAKTRENREKRVDGTSTKGRTHNTRRAWIHRVGACLAYDGIRFGSAALPVPQAAAQVVVARQQSIQHLEQVLTRVVLVRPGGGGRRADY